MGKIAAIQAAVTFPALDCKTVYRLIQSTELPAANARHVYRLALVNVRDLLQEQVATTMCELLARRLCGLAAEASLTPEGYARVRERIGKEPSARALPELEAGEESG
jgi:hypothetical protein